MPLKLAIPRFTLIVMLTIFSQPVGAQNKQVTLPLNTDRQVEYSTDVIVPKTSQSVLLKKALNWIIATKSYKFKKLDLVDNSYGRLVSSGVFVFNNDEVLLHLIIDVKDSKAMLKVSRFDYNMQPGNIAFDNLSNSKTKEARVLIPQVALAMPLLLKSFRDALLAGAPK